MMILVEGSVCKRWSACDELEESLRSAGYGYLQRFIESGIMSASRTSRRAVMSFLMSELVGLWLLLVLVAWLIYEARDGLKWRPTDSVLFAKFAVMYSTPKDPHKEQEPSPEPIDPPNDMPPGEQPSDPLDKPNV